MEASLAGGDNGGEEVEGKEERGRGSEETRSGEDWRRWSMVVVLVTWWL